jgi:sugar phosphate isomerase/epimerase
MQIGIISDEIARPSPAESAAAIAAYGMTAVQLAMRRYLGEMLPAEPDPAALERIAGAFRQNRLAIAAISGTFNLAHPLPAVRQEGVRRFKILAACCRDLGCPLLTLCTGSRDPDNMWRRHPDNDSQEAWRDMAATMRQVLDVAESNNLDVAFECEVSNVVGTVAKAKRIIRESGSGRLKIIMDCANLFHPGEARPSRVREIIGHAFAELGGQIALAHGKDIAAGDGIRFVTTGRGIIDYSFFMQQLKACGYGGAFILHGIQQESELPGCLRLIRSAAARAGL